jgi:hypothetical protein
MNMAATCWIKNFLKKLDIDEVMVSRLFWEPGNARYSSDTDVQLTRRDWKLKPDKNSPCIYHGGVWVGTSVSLCWYYLVVTSTCSWLLACHNLFYYPFTFGYSQWITLTYLFYAAPLSALVVRQHVDPTEARQHAAAALLRMDNPGGQHVSSRNSMEQYRRRHSY